MVDRIIIGKHPDTSVMGMWISKPGFDARTDTNTDNFHFDPSKYLNRPFARLAIASFTRGAYAGQLADGSGGFYNYYRWEFSFYHGLGYVPVFTCQIDNFVSAISADTSYLKCYLKTNFTVSGATNVETDGKRNSGGTMVTPLDATNWYWDAPTNKIVFKKATPSNIAVYRIPLF